jgi:flagellar biosynthesis/type III secretory pathway chaperone
MSLPDLAAVLWRQRELIERLCYRLECEQLLLAAGRTSRLPQATSEVESAVADLQVLEVQRAEAADRAAAELGLPAGSGLPDLAAGAQPPWTGVFLEHRAALIALTGELRALAESNKQLVSGGMAAVEMAINSLGSLAEPNVVAYDAHGHHSGAITGRMAAVVDRVL